MYAVLMWLRFHRGLEPQEVAIPLEFARRYGLAKGDCVSFEGDSNTYIVKFVHSLEETVMVSWECLCRVHLLNSRARITVKEREVAHEL